MRVRIVRVEVRVSDVQVDSYRERRRFDHVHELGVPSVQSVVFRPENPRVSDERRGRWIQTCGSNAKNHQFVTAVGVVKFFKNSD